MNVLKEKMTTATLRMRNFVGTMMTKKDAGESHVITVIAMCVIGIALVLILFAALDPMIKDMCTEMNTKITSMFKGL